jgi:hypothetical protein
MLLPLDTRPLIIFMTPCSYPGLTLIPSTNKFVLIFLVLALGDHLKNFVKSTTTHNAFESILVGENASENVHSAYKDAN